MDGFEVKTNKFYCCLWQGCPRCFHRSMLHYSSVHSDRTKLELYQATCKKEALLCKGGESSVAVVVSLGELCKSDPTRNFVSRRQFTLSSLNPRDGFFNGRTNTCQLYGKVNESRGEEIRYVDVTSLHPTVNKYDVYPVSHTTVLTNPVEDIG